MYNCLEHPVITATERTGYPDGRKEKPPSCPICGSEADTLYQDRDGHTFGCDECIKTKDAWEM